jgi:uracil-DNA glycosylase
MTRHPARPGRELERLSSRVVECRACPRLVDWRETVAATKRAAFADESYWGRPVPSFGDPQARLLIVGLAPAAHGGNRTGRIFTGDRSGDWLFASLHRKGFSNLPESRHKDDGLILSDAYIAAAVRCAPPGNKPSPEERDRCLPYLSAEMRLLARLEVVVALGAFAWDATLRASREGSEGRERASVGTGDRAPRRAPKPRFGHGARADLGAVKLIGCYHPSQQNTFTGKLTEPMLDAVFGQARELFTGQRG